MKQESTKMEPKHTPGPWLKVGTRVFNPRAGTMKRADDCRGGQICEVSGYGNADRKTQLANARLIAAAPDMLAALWQAKALLPNIPAHDPEHYRVALIDAAIAEAEGRT